MRRARPEDLPRMREIIAVAFEGRTIFHVLEQRFGVLGGRPWQEWKADQIDRHFAQHPEWTYVAETDGKVVGVVTFRLDAERKIGEIGNNGVDPAYRNRGIGTAMYRYVLDLFRQAGMRYAEVGVVSDPGNPAVRAYERVGFQPIMESRHYVQEL
jgi:ribosomal protein S18 acetylase RimI-like enzyme